MENKNIGVPTSAPKKSRMKLLIGGLVGALLIAAILFGNSMHMFGAFGRGGQLAEQNAADVSPEDAAVATDLVDDIKKVTVSEMEEALDDLRDDIMTEMDAVVEEAESDALYLDNKIDGVEIEFDEKIENIGGELEITTIRRVDAESIGSTCDAACNGNHDQCLFGYNQDGDVNEIYQCDKNIETGNTEVSFCICADIN